MTFVPILTPGREDNLGPMQVPHDIYELVTNDPAWVDEIDTHSPSTRQIYLSSIRYWMEKNGSCVVRSASSGKFGVIQSIWACNTILMGNEIIDGMVDGEWVDNGEGGDPPPPPPVMIRFTISANPEADTAPMTTTLTINPGNDQWIDAFHVDWGDGTSEIISANELVPLPHAYPIIGDYVLTVQPLDPMGENYWQSKWKVITSRID